MALFVLINLELPGSPAPVNIYHFGAKSAGLPSLLTDFDSFRHALESSLIMVLIRNYGPSNQYTQEAECSLS